MPLFQTIIHPTDFDDPSKEAFRVTRSLAEALGTRVVVFHVVPPPAIVGQDGRVTFDQRNAMPVDLWADYRKLAAGTPKVPIEYAVVVGHKAEAKQMLQGKVHERDEAVLVVMGSHGRTGVNRFLWGNIAAEVVREMPFPVLVVKAPARAATPLPSKAQATARS